MKFFNCFFKVLFFCFLFFDLVIFTLVFLVSDNISTQYKVNKGAAFSINTFVPITAKYNGSKFSQSDFNLQVGENVKVDLKMFGLIPVSTVDVEVVDNMYASVLGIPFGMKIYTKGVLVVEMTSVESQNGNVNPAKNAGVKIGDYIISVDGMKVYSNEDLAEIVTKSNGRKMNFEILRENTTIYINIVAEKSTDTGNYHIGLWVRDSSAGIGTLTFYSPSTGYICGLGHGICDEDTGELISVESGELVSAEIASYTKGVSGSPGELVGYFTSQTLSDINSNCEKGVYGTLSGTIDAGKLVEIALKQEIKEGDAEILCTIEGTTPKLYKCKIKFRSSSFLAPTQNLIVTITDKDLLEKTGGIIQGMSGSPILQNGKLVGAVTHVLIDDPTSGYGIFAENMLNQIQSLKEKSLKDAS